MCIVEEVTPIELSGKKRVEKEVFETIIDGLNSGDLTIEQARQAAKETLATVSKIESHEDSILQFYTGLAKTHPIFEILKNKVQDEIIRSRELSHYKQALTAIDQGDVATAHKIAQSALLQTAHETKID